MFYIYDKNVEVEVQNFIKTISTDPTYATGFAVYEDTHPLPLDHIDAIKQIMPGFEISDDTYKWTETMHDKLVNGQFYEFDQRQPIRL